MRLLNPSKAQRFFMYFLTIGCIIGSILCAIFLWQQCDPPQSLWDPTIEGKCWKPSVAINFFTFVGGKSSSDWIIENALIKGSFLRVYGYLSRRISLYCSVQAAYQFKEEGRPECSPQPRTCVSDAWSCGCPSAAKLMFTIAPLYSPFINVPDFKGSTITQTIHVGIRLNMKVG